MVRYHNLWSRLTRTRLLVIYYYHWSRPIDPFYYLRILHLRCSHPTFRTYHQCKATVAIFRRTQSRTWRHPTKITIDLSTFIIFLIRKHHEVILGIDANELNIFYNNGVSQLLKRTKRIDIIDDVNDLYKVLNTYIRGRHRIDFLLSTEYIFYLHRQKWNHPI